MSWEELLFERLPPCSVKLLRDAFLVFSNMFMRIMRHKNDRSYDPNSLAECISGTFNILIEKFMPVKKMSRKRKSFLGKPWLTKGLKISIRTKNKP